MMATIIIIVVVIIIIIIIIIIITIAPGDRCNYDSSKQQCGDDGEENCRLRGCCWYGRTGRCYHSGKMKSKLAFDWLFSVHAIRPNDS